MLQWQHSAILSTFIKLPFVIKTFGIFSIFEWPFYTGFTVLDRYNDELSVTYLLFISAG